MRYLREHEPQVHYLQRRPMASVRITEPALRARLDTGGDIAMDCSEAVTALCKWAGLRDPNGLGYNGAGFTGTLLASLPHYTNPAVARIGALVVYGPGTGEHVSMVLQPGPDPLLWSHGLEGGPVTVRLSRQRQWHAPPVTFLSIAYL